MDKDTRDLLKWVQERVRLRRELRAMAQCIVDELATTRESIQAKIRELRRDL